MRLLQLATGPDQMLDLHPNVSVVSGLGDDARSVLLDAVIRLARSEAVAGPGLLEAHGVLFDLDGELLSVVGGADLDLNPIVHPDQLPSQPITVDARELRTREQGFAALLDVIAAQAEKQSLARGVVVASTAAVFEARRMRVAAEEDLARRNQDLARLTRRLDELAEERRRLREQLHDVGPALSSAQAARVEVERRTAGIREAMESAIALRASIETELAELDGIRLDDVVAELERATAVLRNLEAEIEIERAQQMQREMDRAATESRGVDDGEQQQGGSAAERLEALEVRAKELDQLLSVITPVERQAIEEARAALAGGASADRVPSPEAARLADKLDRIGEELGDPAADVADGVRAGSLADARARLDDARQGLLEAEQAVRSPEVDRDDVMLLEDVHAELVEAIEKASARFSGGRRRAHRVGELRAAEQEVLDRLGFTSYSGYMMGYSLFNTDPVKEELLDEARRELSAAEDEWRKFEEATEAALVRAEALDRRRSLLEQARDMLGRTAPAGPPQEALRGLMVPATSGVESARALQAALGAVGMELEDEELDREELVIIADAWLSEADQIDGRRRTTVEELAALEAERAELLERVAAEQNADDEPDLDAAELAGPDAEARRLEALAHARAELAAKERQLVDSTAAEERRAVLAADLATARDLERSAAASSEGAGAEIAAALDLEGQLATKATNLQEDLVRANRQFAEAEDAVRGLADPGPGLGPLDAEIVGAEAKHAEAIAELEVVDHALATLDAEGSASALAIERLQDIVAAQGSGTTTPADELEWYLLARLAAQRAVSIAGSVPLVLDDALRGLDIGEIGRVLDRLERMAEAVQVIVISEDPVVASWAGGVGPARAAVVRLTPC